MKIQFLTPLLFFLTTAILAQTVTTGNVTSPICAGLTINLSLTASGGFNNDNVFTVQLSDSSGNFGSPDTIGNLYNTTSGSITCNIPANALHGTGYLVRIVSSDPAITGSSSNAITIEQAPQVNDFHLSFNTEPCQGSAATITVKSSSLWTGAYTVYYNMRGGINAVGDSAAITFTSGNPGSGTFTTPPLNTIDTTVLTVITIKSNSTSCSSISGSGNVYNVLHVFTQPTGWSGEAGLTQINDSLFYGMTGGGGANSHGAVFQYNLNTNAYTKVFDFAGSSNGEYPSTNLMQANNGLLYGITQFGGVNNMGVLFQFNPVGNIYTKLHDFITATGSYPTNGLIQASNGFLYGVTSEGGSTDGGVIFRYAISSNTYDTVYNFGAISYYDARSPYCNLVQANNGLLYGDAGGGANDYGAIFAFNSINNTYDTIYSFQSPYDATLTFTSPGGGLLQAYNGLFYGVRSYGGIDTVGSIFGWNQVTNSYVDLYSFNKNDGIYPNGRLYQSKNGLLYGLTQSAVSAFGVSNAGTLFKLNPINNVATTLLEFDTLNTSYVGWGYPIQANNGLLYVVTSKNIFEYGALGITTLVPIPVYPPIISVLDSSCNGSPATLLASCIGDTALSFSWSNGATDSIITTNQPGYDSVRVTTTQGCLTPYSQAFPFPAIPNCGGLLLLQSDSIINFDTLQVNVYVENADSLFSISAYLHFDSSLLQLVWDTVGNFYGPSPNNLVYQTPGSGLIDFEIASAISHVGVSGNGLLYTFKFKLLTLPNSIASNAPFTAYTLLTLSNPSVLDALGNQRDVSMPKPDTALIGIEVWPGDLNNDHVVNVLDILPIGYFYLFTGPARDLYCSPNCNQWSGQPAQIWGSNISAHNSSAYETFADANGDGVINLGDAADIQFNLGSIHALKPKSNGPTNARSVYPPLTAYSATTQIDSTQLPYTLNVSVNLGSPAMPVDYVLGIAFDLLFDADCVDTNSLTTNSVTYSNLFGTYQTDYIRVADFTQKAEGKISFGITRFGVPPINGNGDSILNVSFKLVNGCNGGYFHIIPNILGCDSADGGPILLSNVGDSIRVIATGPSAINNVEITSRIKIFPNPANDLLTIYSPNNISSVITLYDVNGQIILTQNFIGVMQNIDISPLASGVYIINVRNSSETITQKIIKE